jgi:predicted amidohydrolase YtcJ
MIPLLLVFLLNSMHTQSSSVTADFLFLNANIRTVDPERPAARAVAVKDGRILAVGSEAEVGKYRGPSTKVIDVGGKLLIPGFIDNHTHFVSGGFQLQNVDLRYAKDQSEFGRLIRERALQYPGKWITGGDWDHDNWPDGALPTRELIDEFTPSTPVFVSRYDGHMALANSFVLNLAGVTRDSPDPPGGSIVRDPVTGEPTGILKDEAMSYVWKHIPDPTDDEILDAVRRALAESRRLGVTSIQDMSFPSHVEAYRRLQKEGELTARMYCRLPISMTGTLIEQGVTAGSGDAWVRTGSLKAFADGSLGSSTALFFDPYVSDPSTRGLPSDIVLDGRLHEWALAADRAHLQLSIHAIGDSANSLVLDLFETIIRENPPWDRRFRIEHAQHIHPKDFERMARLGVIASVQPYHAIDDGRWAEGRIGYERCKTTYPFRSFIDTNVRMCFGSDWTVAPLNPLLGIYAAVTRRTTDGATPNGWIPGQKVTVQEAVEAYTIHNAFAAFEEHEKGSISTGKLADFVVLADDIFTIDPVKIQDVKVEMTVVGGRVMYPE